MSNTNLVNLIALADSAAKHASGSLASSVSVDVEVTPGTVLPRVVATLLDLDAFPPRGEFGDRIRITHSGSYAWLRITGDVGDDVEQLLHEAIDILTEQPLVETAVTL
ncbi:hypothetical protein [Gordonia sp. SND2]|uniref:hypothetical protein n=1 Tax=Gordonia sp. SND2 TaxID=3388659 RepID=UPI00398AD7FD